MPQRTTPITLLQGQEAASNTQYVAALPVNVSGILMPIMGAAGYMQQEPGLTEYGTGAGVDRGGVWNARMNQLFRVSGSSLISVDASGTSTVLGTTTIGLIGPQAAMPYSFNTQAIIVDGKYFLYDPINGARRVLDPEVGLPIDAVWVDGYYFFTDGEYLYHTDLEDEEAIDPLKYASAEFSPDATLGVSLTTDDKVIVWNRFTIEFFENTANEFFAFTRIKSRTIQFGLVGTYCKAQIGGDWFFMGGPAQGNTSIYLLGVGTAKNLASREVDKLIALYNETELALCSLETRIVDNYPEVIVRLPDYTLKLNLKVASAAGVEQAWSILQSGTAEATPYRAIHGVYDTRRAQWVYGDTIDDRLGYLDPGVATHYEDLIECVLYTPFIYLETQSIDSLMIQTIPGFSSSPQPPPPPPPPPPGPSSYMGVGGATSPFINNYAISGSTFTKLANPASLPPGTVRAVAWSHDGRYEAVGHDTSPFITVYDWNTGSPVKIADPSGPDLPGGVVSGAAWSNDLELCCAHSGGDNMTRYSLSTGSFVKLAAPAVPPSSASQACAYSDDGAYLALGIASSPNVFAYSRSAGVLTKLSNPADLPAGAGTGVAWSIGGAYLSVSHGTTPFVTIYLRTGSTLGKISNPTTLPAGTGNATAFSPDDYWLAVAHATTPFVTIYQFNLGIPVKIANPSTLPASTGNGVAFSNDSRFMTVAHTTTPFESTYDFQTGAPVKLANPVTLPNGNGLATAFSPD